MKMAMQRIRVTTPVCHLVLSFRLIYDLATIDSSIATTFFLELLTQFCHLSFLHGELVADAKELPARMINSLLCMKS
jgi:hypothetical protein